MVRTVWGWGVGGGVKNLGYRVGVDPLLLLLLLVFFNFFFISYFYSHIVPLGFLPSEIRVTFPGESHLQQSRATQPVVYAGCFSVSIIQRTPRWTIGFLTFAQMLMYAIAHEVYGHT